MNKTTAWKSSPESREEILSWIQNHPELKYSFYRLNTEYRERFLDFFRGTKTLPITYDPFFKMVFHPDVHPDRLSSLISSLLGIPVKVKAILPTEDRLTDADSLLIMDILVELEDGSLTNVEIQKIPYAFPKERISCYSSDLVMRQYTRARGERGKHFSYRDMKKVYTIVIFEKSEQIFHQDPTRYIHLGRTQFDTSLNLPLLQEYCLVCLDVFRKIPYSEREKNKQTAWLSFLLTETMQDADQLVSDYPWLKEIYQELAMLRQKPEEVLGMFSDALKIMDKNTVKYMVDEQRKIMEEQQQAIDAQWEEIASQQQEIASQQQEIASQQQKIASQQQEMNARQQIIEKQQKRIQELESLLAQRP